MQKPVRITNLFIQQLLLLCLGLFAFTTVSLPQRKSGRDEKYTGYLFTYFTGNSKAGEAIRFALSDDGYHFHALNNNEPVVSSARISSTGGVRDPHILRSADGKTFYMVATDMISANGWNSNRAMVLLKSTDLLNWSSSIVNIQKKFPGNEDLLRVWAPQTIYDEKAGKYMIYWSMKHGKDPDRIYYAYANADFTDLETVPQQLFFSPSNGACIDGDIVLKKGRYHLFFKTEGAGAGIKIAVSDKLTGGYILQDRYVQQTKDPVEGAGVFKLNNSDEYILMYDVYTKGKYQFTKTKDLGQFTVIDEEVSMDFHPRHGTIMPITAKEAERLTDKWGKQGSSANDHRIFQVKDPDFSISPHTGMTRKHWKDAALYILQGAFSYVHGMDDPMKFPKQPGKSYPRNEGQLPTEKLEGLCRTLFVAAPLLRENASLEINHIKVADYYRYQITRLIDSGSTSFIKHRAKNGGPNQILVEFGALSLSLFAAPEILWDPLTPSQKDELAATMLSYGDGPTVASNWKFFNIFVLSFFKSKGYTVNEKLLVEYLDKSLEHYRGNGWYNDAPAYDYYSMWAFQMYGPVWAEFFGKKYYPSYAEKFMTNFKEVKNNYPYLFSRNGEMIMWGRSISYRIGSVIPFPLMGLENDPAINYGWMRRISSGVILQFLQNPDFLKDSIPTLGFYGAFEPAVQSYSCRGSVFWMGKAFMSLLIPENNPFWTATENEGAWETAMKKGQVYNRFQDKSNILITDYPDIGASEVRAWCKVKAIGANEPFRSSENYNRLSYNSAFPWQADSSNGAVAMNYVVKNRKNEWEPLRLYDFKKFEDEIYYRDAVMETNPGIKLSLADLPMANGILRVDKISADTSFDLRIGHYALPHVKGTISTKEMKVKGYNVQIIDNGIYQLAMVSVKGWKSIEVVLCKGLHPVSDESSVLNAAGHYTPGDKGIYMVLMLWKRSGEEWTKDELVPFKSVSFTSTNNETATIVFKNGEQKIIR